MLCTLTVGCWLCDIPGYWYAAVVGEKAMVILFCADKVCEQC